VRFALAKDDVPAARLEVSVGGGQPVSGVQFVKGSL
jgi:hypothetical protein